MRLDHVTPPFVTDLFFPLLSLVAVPAVEARRSSDVFADAVRGADGFVKFDV